MNPLGIDKLSLFGLSPVASLELAAELGCDCMGTGLEHKGGAQPNGQSAWSFRQSRALVQDTRAASRALGIAIAVCEGFAVLPGSDMRDCAADLDVVAELGCGRVAVVSIGRDRNQAIDGYGALAQIAAERGLAVSAEMGSLGPVRLVDDAVAVVREVGQPNFTLLLDAMHFFRLGNSLADLERLDPAMIGYVQLCDAPWQPRFDTYMEEAMYERMIPGEGELPLAGLLRHVPADVVVSLEVPLRSLAEQGWGPRERMAPCVAAARKLLQNRRVA